MYVAMSDKYKDGYVVIICRVDDSTLLKTFRDNKALESPIQERFCHSNAMKPV